MRNPDIMNAPTYVSVTLKSDLMEAIPGAAIDDARGLQ